MWRALDHKEENGKEAISAYDKGPLAMVSKESTLTIGGGVSDDSSLNSKLPKQKGQNPLSQFQVGDVIPAKVITVSRQHKKIWLSIRKQEERSEKDSHSSSVN